MKNLSYTRSTVTERPTTEQVQKAVQLAQMKYSTNQARMQFPKTENYQAMNIEEKPKQATLKEYNESRLTSDKVLTGRELRRKRRKEKR